jgi:penicillin-binding protein 2
MSTTISDPHAERRMFQRRTWAMWVLMLIMMSTLIARMAYLQIDQHKTYTTLSDKNRVQLQPERPTRGLIYDRRGRLLAENRPSYSLTLVREQVVDLEQTLAGLQSLIDLNDEDIERFYSRLQQVSRPFQPITLKPRLSDEEIAILAVNQYFYPGIEVEAELVRYYPYGEATAHVLGYVGSINEKELQALDPINYAATRRMGKTGIEKYYENLLHGTVGYRKVETNARGRVLRVLSKDASTPGEQLNLYLDVELQLAGLKAFGDYRGALVAIDVKRGGILAMISNPAFDPNLFVTGISTSDYSGLRDNPDLPLFNRAVRGLYPPGSTIKMFMGLGLLDSGVTSWSHKINDPGYYRLDNDERYYRDWKRGGHGLVDLKRSIVESCDTYFYQFSVKAGIDHLHEFLSKFGFGQQMGLDVWGARQGLLPSREWKRVHRNRSWYAGDTVNMSIGQGFTQASILQLATATAVLGNRGKTIKPHFLNRAEYNLQADQDWPNITLKRDKDWDDMLDAFEQVVASPRGTAHRLSSGIKYRMGAKTGTAQVVGIKQNEEYDSDALAERHRDHALLVALAPMDDPQIAIAVIAENAESAGKVAGPIAKKVMDRFFELEAEYRQQDRDAKPLDPTMTLLK